MAKITLDICNECAGITFEKMMSDKNNAVGGCAITICELCGNSIPNTMYVYRKDLFVHDRGLISNLIKDNNRIQMINLETIKGPSDYVIDGAFSYKNTLLKINQKLNIFGGKVEFKSMNTVAAVKEDKTIVLNEMVMNEVEALPLLIWGYNTALSSSEFTTYKATRSQEADKKTILDIQKIIKQSCENDYVKQLKELADLPFYEKLFNV